MSLEISVVTPTFREAENLPALIKRIAESLHGRNYEIIVADDVSGDNTPEVCAELEAEYPVRLLSRTTERGLSPAVIDGIAAAKGSVVVVMDADLSHPPEKIPELAAPLENKDADFVVGSRYVQGGALAGEWPWYRRLNSWGATQFAKPLAPLADPMSGFFALRREDMPPRERLSPIGYKIGLENAVKAGFSKQKFLEVPIFFDERAHGESKLTLREQLNYIRHLRRLYHHRWPKKMEAFQFGAVGGVGFVCDALCYFGLQALGLPHLTARALAFWPSVSCNWFLNRIMTFKTRVRTSAGLQWAQFAMASLIGFCINWGAYALLTSYVEFFAERLFLAFIAGVLAGAVFNFIIADSFIFRRK